MEQKGDGEVSIPQGDPQRRYEMANWGRAEHKTSGFLKELDRDDLYAQLDTIRTYLGDLTRGLGKASNRQLGRARGLAIDTAHDAEDLMKDNLAASLILALGLGVLVGYMIRRGSE
jgi:hypothetical protein